MIFELVDAQRAHYSVEMLCDVLDVSRAGFYAWKKRGVSQRRIDDAKLAVEITKIHEESDKAYGSPRVHVALEKARSSRESQTRGACHAAGEFGWKTTPRISCHHDDARRDVADRAEPSRASLRAERAEPRLGRRHHLPLDAGGLDVDCGADRSLLATRRRLGDELEPLDRLAAHGVAHGHPHATSASRAYPSHRSGLPIREPRVPPRAQSTRYDLQHESTAETVGTMLSPRVSSRPLRSSSTSTSTREIKRARDASSTLKASTIDAGCTRVSATRSRRNSNLSLGKQHRPSVY